MILLGWERLRGTYTLIEACASARLNFEEELQVLLPHEELAIGVEVAPVLGQVGTGASLDALKRHTRWRTERALKDAATDAIARIEERAAAGGGRLSEAEEDGGLALDAPGSFES